MHKRKRFTHWILILLLAMILLAGCARGERNRSGVQEPPAVSEGADPTEPFESELKEMDQMLGDLEKEINNTDTQIEIP